MRVKGMIWNDGKKEARNRKEWARVSMIQDKIE